MVERFACYYQIHNRYGSSLYFAGLMKSVLNKWTSVNELMKSALMLML